jgi:hypothetical protein
VIDLLQSTLSGYAASGRAASAATAASSHPRAVIGPIDSKDTQKTIITEIRNGLGK